MIDLDLLILIILNVLLFFFFALVTPVNFRRKKEAATLSVIAAETFGFSHRLSSLVSFIVTFFIAMHGFPVSIYAILWALGSVPQVDYLLGVPGLMLFFVGGLLVLLGWSKIYNAEGKLVTDGVYKHVRHPQNLAILLATLGMIVYRFSPISALLWPVLLILYYRLGKREEKDMENKFGEGYREYRRNVPMLIPFTFIRRTRE